MIPIFINKDTGEICIFYYNNSVYDFKQSSNKNYSILTKITIQEFNKINEKFISIKYKRPILQDQYIIDKIKYINTSNELLSIDMYDYRINNVFFMNWIFIGEIDYYTNNIQNIPGIYGTLKKKFHNKELYTDINYNDLKNISQSWYLGQIISYLKKLECNKTTNLKNNQINLLDIPKELFFKIINKIFILF